MSFDTSLSLKRCSSLLEGAASLVNYPIPLHEIAARDSTWVYYTFEGQVGGAVSHDSVHVDTDACQAADPADNVVAVLRR